MKKAALLLFFGCLLLGFVLSHQEVLGKTPAPGNTTWKNIVRRMEVREGESCRNLTIFPVFSNEWFGLRNLSSLDEALKSDRLAVTEVGSGEVNTLMVENTGKQRVFIMSGEILTGCKQDRILKEDLLIPPRSGRIKVSAYCTEHGRWTAVSDKFGSGGTIANQAVRQTAVEKREQSAVWDSISKTYARAAPSSAGSSGYASEALDKVYHAPEFRSSADVYLRRLSAFAGEHPGVKGVVVAVGGRILCADVFGDADLFKQLWMKLLKSYVLEAQSLGDGGRADVEDARDFLAECGGSSLHFEETPGEGRLLKLDSSEVSGGGLILGENLIHAGLFPRSEPVIEKKEWEETPAIQRRYRR